MIVRPASSLVVGFVFFFVSPEMALKDGCARATSVSRSFHLCSVEKKPLRSLKCVLKQVTADYVGKQETFVS